MHSILKVLALSYKNTPLEIRERLAFDEETSKLFLRKLKEILGIQEAMLVSTCNRTEIYYTHQEDLSTEISGLLKIEKGFSSDDHIADYFRSVTDADKSSEHLFRVALGLEAQVIGDIQISNQVKNAYQWSADENMAGPFLHRLMHSIFFSNKRVVQETAFRDGAASVSYAAVNYINELTSAIIAPRILVLGLGEIGVEVVRNLAAHSKAEIYLCNRTQEKAEKLADEYGFNILPFENFSNHLPEFDAVVSSVRAEKPVITKDLLKSDRVLTHKFLFDLSVPRSIDKDVEDVPGVLLYNIDGIREKADETLLKREKAIPAVEKIVEEALSELRTWSREMEVSPTIQKLKNALEEIRQAELSRYTKKMTENELQMMDTVTRGMMQKIIKLPVLQLKAACKRGEAETLIDVLNDLFDLEKQVVQNK